MSRRFCFVFFLFHFRRGRVHFIPFELPASVVDVDDVVDVVDVVDEFVSTADVSVVNMSINDNCCSLENDDAKTA